MRYENCNQTKNLLSFRVQNVQTKKNSLSLKYGIGCSQLCKGYVTCGLRSLAKAAHSPAGLCVAGAKRTKRNAVAQKLLRQRWRFGCLWLAELGIAMDLAQSSPVLAGLAENDMMQRRYTKTI